MSIIAQTGLLAFYGLFGKHIISAASDSLISKGESCWRINGVNRNTKTLLSKLYYHIIHCVLEIWPRS